MSVRKSGAKTQGKKKSKLADRAELFLEKRGLDVRSLKIAPVKQIPKKIAVQKLSVFQNRQKQSLEMFAEAYARYLLFKSPNHFPGLSGSCQTFQQMAAGKRTKSHTGLVRCILGMNPNDDKKKQRDAVTKFYTACTK